jgi:hypothetical protein
MNPVTVVLTPSMVLVLGTSSTYTPGDRYSGIAIPPIYALRQ